MVDQLAAVGTVLGSLLAALVAVGAVKDRWPVSWLLRRLVSEPVEEVIDRRIEHHPKLDAISKELHPNGGESMRDAIDRTEHRVALLDKRVERLETDG